MVKGQTCHILEDTTSQAQVSSSGEDLRLLVGSVGGQSLMLTIGWNGVSLRRGWNFPPLTLIPEA